MKTQVLRTGGLGLLLAGVVAVTGSSNTPSGVVGTSNSPPATTSNNAPDLLTYQPAPEVAQITNQIVSATNEDRVVASPTLPANMRFSPNLTEVAKLIQAGVDESVVRTFISNTSGAFNVGSDEIVYLNDLGASGEVVLALMQHDRAWNASAQGAPAPADTTPPPVAETGYNLAETAETAAVEYAPPTTVVVPQEPVTVNYFYDTLSPYGTWIEIGGYGRCWQPTIVLQQPMWRPYCDNGRWIYTDCGWYWASDYSWGAAFHYGRWFNHPRRGWCWAPDTVWSPAWVSWRSSSDYCGWAPLPPGTGWIPGVGFGYRDHAAGYRYDFGLTADCFTFVHYNHFRDRHVQHHAMPHHEAARIVNQTTVVNNFVHGNNNTIINHGIAPERVAAASGTPVNPVPVSQVAAHRPGGGPGQPSRPAFNRPSGSQPAPGGRTGRPDNDSHRSPNANDGNRNHSTPLFTHASPATPNSNSSVHQQRPANWRDRVPAPGQSQGRPDNTATATADQPPAHGAPTTTAPGATTVSSPWTAIGSQRAHPANQRSRPKVELTRFRSSPPNGEAIAGTPTVGDPTPAITVPQVEHRPAQPARTQAVVPRPAGASWSQADFTRNSRGRIRVQPSASPRQVALNERPQFQSPPVVAPPQTRPQAPVVSATQPSPRSPERAVRVTRNDTQSSSTYNGWQQNSPNWSGRQAGRR